MWTVVYMAQNKEVAEKLKEILSKEGIFVKLSPVSKKEKDDNYFEILVLESEVEEAHSKKKKKGF